jgi:hypothetical protein
MLRRDRAATLTVEASFSWLWIAASIALDDPQQLARMMFDVAYINNGDVRHGHGIIDGAAEPVHDPPVAAPRPRRQAFGENFGRRGDGDHGDIGVGPAHRVNHFARYVGDHYAPGADVFIDRAGQCVAMAMRFPMYGKITARERLPEGIKAHLLIVFEG